jgi:glyoxylase-like metal-dependent hydrolase (beta-lactamase superfamily II)
MTLKIGIVPVTPLQQNCSILWDDETMRGSIVDPGGDVPKLLSVLAENGITLTGIYVTHGHMDHAGGATELAEHTGLPVTGPHIADKFLLEDMAAMGARFGLLSRNCTPDAWVREGDIVSLGGAAFEVRHCPGHTPGHVVFINHALQFGIVGDVLFRGSIGRTDLGDYGNHEQLMASIRAKLLTLPDEFQFICGHGPGSTIGHERRTNPFLQS